MILAPRRFKSALLSAPVILAVSTSRVQACAACFGQSDSPMAHGMNMGIFTLLIVVLSVLIGIAAFFVYILRRASRLASTNGVQPETKASTLNASGAEQAVPQLSQ